MCEAKTAYPIYASSSGGADCGGNACGPFHTLGEQNETAGSAGNITGLAAMASTRYYLGPDGGFARVYGELAVTVEDGFDGGRREVSVAEYLAAGPGDSLRRHIVFSFDDHRAVAVVNRPQPVERLPAPGSAAAPSGAGRPGHLRARVLGVALGRIDIAGPRG